MTAPTARTRALLVGLAGLALAAPAAADRIVTEDGRVVRLKKARKTDTGYQLIFEHGELHVTADAGIKAIEIEGDMSDYVPRNDDEREKLEQGYVRYRDQWMTKARYETELQKEYEAAKERADFLAAHSDWSSCWTAETRHFVINTNTSPELLEYYGTLLESYYDLMDKQIGIDPTLSYRRKKMTVNIYKSHEEFQKLSAAGVGPSTLGYFWSYDDTLNFFHDYSEPALSDWVALHECTHLLTFLIDQQYATQIWLNEGVADYFGAAEIEVDDRGRIEIEPGQVQVDRILTVQQAMKDGEDTKLDKLLFLDRGEFDGFQYAHAWSFVYFLNNYKNGKYAKGFWKAFKELYTRNKKLEYEVEYGGGQTGTAYRASPEAIRDHILARIGVKDLAELETQWKEFVAAIPIESADARLKRGINTVRMFRVDEFDQAIADLDAAIEGGTEDPRAWAYRARARAMKGGAKAGIEDMKKAIEKDPLNAAFHFELSRMLSGYALSSTGGPGSSVSIGSSSGDGPGDPEAKKEAGLAMELDPENDRFREWYASFQ